MEGFVKFLHALLSRSSPLRSAQKTGDKTSPPEEDKDRILALKLRKTVEDGRMFLRPGLSLEDVAIRLDAEADAVGRAFVRFIGGDFNRYIDELRIAYAAVLFMGHESHLYSMDKIGTACGFPDNAAFGEACRKLTGRSPDTIRKLARAGKTLKGLFLTPPAYLTTSLCDTLEDEFPK